MDQTGTAKGKLLRVPRKVGRKLDPPHKHHSYSIRHKGSAPTTVRISLSAPSLGRRSKNSHTTKLRAMMQNQHPKPHRAVSVQGAEVSSVEALRRKEQQLMRPSSGQRLRIPSLDLDLRSEPSFLPLELFDDEDKFEKVRPKDWLPALEDEQKEVMGCSRWHRGWLLARRRAAFGC